MAKETSTSKIGTTLEQYWSLRDQFHASDGVKLYNHFLSTQLSYYTFEVNFRELHDFIKLHFRPKLKGGLGDWENKQPLHDYLTELTRRPHNCLPSAKSLVDHTRNFVKDSYPDHSVARKEFDAEISKRFTTNPVCKFTQDLRVFFTHIRMPFISSVTGGSKATGRDIYTLQTEHQKDGPS
jgi:hypothetical protein